MVQKESLKGLLWFCQIFQKQLKQSNKPVSYPVSTFTFPSKVQSCAISRNFSAEARPRKRKRMPNSSVAGRRGFFYLTPGPVLLLFFLSANAPRFNVIAVGSAYLARAILTGSRLGSGDPFVFFYNFNKPVQFQVIGKHLVFDRKPTLDIPKLMMPLNLGTLLRK